MLLHAELLVPELYRSFKISISEILQIYLTPVSDVRITFISNFCISHLRGPSYENHLSNFAPSWDWGREENLKSLDFDNVGIRQLLFQTIFLIILARFAYFILAGSKEDIEW